MNHKTEKWIRERLRPLLKKDRLLLIVLTGALILVITLPTGKKTGEGNLEYAGSAQDVSHKESYGIGEVKTSGSQEELGKGVREDSYELAAIGEYGDERSYVKTLEEELCGILSSIEGAGKVRVMITLEESGELIVEKDQKEMQKQTLSNEGNDEMMKSGRESSLEKLTVYEEGTKEKAPFVVKQVYPKIKGVIVAAQGVGKGTIRAELSEAVQALFGIEAHKVKVLKLCISASKRE